MRSTKLVWTLAVLNVLLVVLLLCRVLGSAAHAQMVNRTEYVMIPAEVPGAPNGVIYIMDTRNGLLSAFLYNQTTRDLETIEPIPVQRLFAGAIGQPH